MLYPHMIINRPGFWSLESSWTPSFRGRFRDHTNLQARVRQGVRALVVNEILLGPGWAPGEVPVGCCHGKQSFFCQNCGFHHDFYNYIYIYQQIWCSMHWLKVKSNHGFTEELVCLSSFTFAMKQFWGVGKSFCGYYMDDLWMASALDRSGQIIRAVETITAWWFQPLWKY